MLASRRQGFSHIAAWAIRTGVQLSPTQGPQWFSDTFTAGARQGCVCLQESSHEGLLPHLSAPSQPVSAPQEHWAQTSPLRTLPGIMWLRSVCQGAVIINNCFVGRYFGTLRMSQFHKISHLFLSLWTHGLVLLSRLYAPLVSYLLIVKQVTQLHTVHIQSPHRLQRQEYRSSLARWVGSGSLMRCGWGVGQGRWG